MNKNQIYIRIGRPKRFREEDKPMGAIKLFIVKLGIVLIVIYFLGKLLLSYIW